MKRFLFLCFVFTILFTACTTDIISEPERCSLCSAIPRHAPCIINLSTGDVLELEIYEPHPTLVAEIAEEQRGGYFSFVRGAGVEGYKLGAEKIVTTLPIKTDKLEKKYFCNICRSLLEKFDKEGYALVDLKDTQNPTVFRIEEGQTFTLRCYEVSIRKITDASKYEITVIGTHTAN